MSSTNPRSPEETEEAGSAAFDTAYTYNILDLSYTNDDDDDDADDTSAVTYLSPCLCVLACLLTFLVIYLAIGIDWDCHWID